MGQVKAICLAFPDLCSVHVRHWQQRCCEEVCTLLGIQCMSWLMKPSHSMHRTALTQRLVSYASKISIFLIVIVVIRKDARPPWPFHHLFALQMIGMLRVFMDAQT